MRKHQVYSMFSNKIQTGINLSTTAIIIFIILLLVYYCKKRLFKKSINILKIDGK